MKKNYYFVAATVAAMLVGCSADPREEAIDQHCLGLEKIEESKQRNEQYMQCRKACGDAEIYNMEDGEKKDELTQKCKDAGKIGDTAFKKSPERNWLGVMP